MRPEKYFFGEQSMVIVFSVNRYLVPQKREKRENRLFRER
jgi:hypothetical protein